MAIFTAKRMYLTGPGSETGVLGGVRIKPIGVDDGFPSRACSVITYVTGNLGFQAVYKTSKLPRQFMITLKLPRQFRIIHCLDIMFRQFMQR